MAAADRVSQRDIGLVEGPSGLRWRRVFPGEDRQLGILRRWLKSLLPECPARDDVLGVASELGSNAIQHTASGDPGGWFAVELTWHESAVQVAVADCGSAAEPKVVDDLDGERGRGLLLVQGLSLRAGWAGDGRGRLVWAQIAWSYEGSAFPGSSRDPYKVAIRDDEAALARRFAGVPAWFGQSTLQWWALAGWDRLVSAPSARELAGLLHRLLDGPQSAQPPAGRADYSAAVDPVAPQSRRERGTRNGAGRCSDPGSSGRDGGRRPEPVRSICLLPGLAVAGAA